MAGLAQTGSCGGCVTSARRAVICASIAFAKPPGAGDGLALS